MGGPLDVAAAAQAPSFEEAVAALRKQYETKPEEPVSEDAAPPLKVFLHAIVNHMSLTLDEKQRLYDLLTTEFGRHASDPLRPGTVAINTSAPVTG